MAAAEEDKDGKDHFKPKTDQNVITEEDMVEIQLLDDFLTTHQRKFEQRKMLWTQISANQPGTMELAEVKISTQICM